MQLIRTLSTTKQQNDVVRPTLTKANSSTCVLKGKTSS